MSALAFALGLLTGVFLAVQAVASCYGIIDHWFALRRHRWRVGVGIAVWCGLVLIVLSFDNVFADGFVFGAKLVVAAHVLVIVLGWLILPAVRFGERLRLKALLASEEGGGGKGGVHKLQ